MTVKHGPEPLVDIAVEEPDWEVALPDFHEISTLGITLGLDAAGVSQDDFSVSLLACDDARISALNNAFRGKDQATNVLSWPASDLSPDIPGDLPTKPVPGAVLGRTPLGDVAIALQTCTREAENAGIPLKNHVTHLILHACLHLLGYDHEAQDDAVRMEDCERAALATIGISDPYA